MANKEIKDIKVQYDKKSDLYFSTVTFKDSSKPVHIIVSNFNGIYQFHNGTVKKIIIGKKLNEYRYEKIIA